MLRTIALCLTVFSCSTFMGQARVDSPFHKALASPSVSIHTLNLTGTATWIAGSTHESGTATLQAGVDGSLIMQLALDTATRTDAMSSVDGGRTCLWTDRSGVNHQVAGPNCWTAIPWFAPGVFSQNITALPTHLHVSDLGVTTKDGVNCHELDYTIDLIGPTDSLTQQAIEASRVKVFYDPQSLAPTSLEYSVALDKDDLTRFPVRVVFSDYRIVSGVSLPFHVDRYIQNSLQLSLSFSNASFE